MSGALLSTGRLAACAATVLLTVGCASNGPKPLYGWEGYQPQVYAYLKSGGNADAVEQLAQLEQAEQNMAQRGQALPPGYRAHMGMLYAKAGDAGKSAAAITAEKTHFPESSSFMDFLLRTLKPKAEQ